MELINPDISGSFVQAVHVLGHDPPEFVLFLQFIQVSVNSVRFRVREQQMFPVIIKERLRLQIEKGFAENCLGIRTVCPKAGI